MCGIAGILGKEVSPQAIHHCSDVLAHRGPDAVGIYHQDDVCLIHRRLSIIDLSDAANQPMYSEDGRWVIVFNGEIYNYRELRAQLEQQGIRFTTQSDTEVVLKAFMHQGPDCVQSFIGMFAIALYDTQEGRMFLLRDRVGVKPLYYHQGKGVLLFGSELRSLYSWGVLERSVSKPGLAAYLSLGYLPADNCIMDQVHKVPPGHMITWTKSTGQLKAAPYWNLEEKINGKYAGNSLEDNTERLEELMISSVKYRMVADVPVGVFLSGGIDSSLVTALLQKHFGNIRTFTIGFDDPVYNESGYADKVAQHLGTEHHSRILNAGDARNVLHEYFDMYDEPFADSSGIPTNLVSKFAREQGCKVVLSADGGDELFGGYGRYVDASRSYQKLKRMPGGALYTAAYGSLLRSTRHAGWKNAGNKLAKLNDWVTATAKGFSSFYPAYLSVPSQELITRFAGINLDTPGVTDQASEAESMMLWDFKNYLPDDLLVKVDRATMFNHIEGREPLLDHRLIEFAFNLPLAHKIAGGQHKVILRHLLDRYIPRSFFERPKMGFSIPLFKWFGQDLESEFAWAFDPAVLQGIGYLDGAEIGRQYRLYLKLKQQNRQDNLLLIWHLYCLVKWHYRYMQL
jgi:asparagine synthase (glutamine-hydrolysing)